MAIENAQGIAVTEQTKTLRRLAYDGLMIRDHALHLYFFVLPDLLGVDSILDIPMTRKIPATPSCTIPSTSSGSARTSPTPPSARRYTLRGRPWGFPEDPRPAKFPDLVARLEAVRPQVIRGIETFLEWDASLIRNTDYLAGVRNETRFDFLEGDVVNSNGRRIARRSLRTTCSTCRYPTRTQKDIGSRTQKKTTSSAPSRA